MPRTLDSSIMIIGGNDAEASSVRMRYHIAVGDLSEPERYTLKTMDLNQSVTALCQAAVASAKTSEGIT